MIIFIANCSAISNTYSMEIQMARVTKYKHALQLLYHQSQQRTVNNDYTMYILTKLSNTKSILNTEQRYKHELNSKLAYDFSA